MNPSRDEILKSLRQHLLPVAELPSLEREWIAYPDLRRQFLEVLGQVGGTGHVVADRPAADAILAGLDCWKSAKKTCSLVAGVGRSTFDLFAVADPHDLEDVDVAVLPGEFGVAENAAVWVTDRNLPHRVLYFLVQHLVLVVPAGALVPTLHAAYERIAEWTRRTGRATFDEPVFSAFVSGPSKTADIEQSLVIGAHGARSLTVLLVESDPPDAPPNRPDTLVSRDAQRRRDLG